jgi:hypothetical protein
MSYISFTALTTTPKELRDRMVARGIFKLEDGQYVGVNPGTEYLEVPNPIVKTPAVGTPFEPGYVPPVMDTRRCYMVKLAHEAEAADDSNDADDPEDNHPRFTRSKLAQWVKANGTATSETDKVVRQIKDPAQYEDDTIDPETGDTIPGAKLPDTYTTVKSPLRTWAMGGLLSKKFWIVHPQDADIFGTWQ